MTPARVGQARSTRSVTDVGDIVSSSQQRAKLRFATQQSIVKNS